MMVEGIKGDGGGGGRIGEVEDMGDGMQCSAHPYRNNPGGICAFCLQEKLGKLVSSSFPLPIRASSSSSSPSFRSDTAASKSTATATVAAAVSSLSSAIHLTSAKINANANDNGNGNGNKDCQYHEYCTRRARIPFLSAKKKKKLLMNSSSASASTADIAFKRSKSTATPRRGRHFFADADHEDDDIIIEDFSPRKRIGFRPFFYLSSKSGSATKKVDRGFKENHYSSSDSTFNGATSSTKTTAGSAVVKHTSSGKRGVEKVVVEYDDSSSSQATASASSFERKVSRSRSVGCGSRSFSGDFFERISTGFGDCTLRRVESQREGKTKVANGGSALTRDQNHHHCIKERVKCGGIFGGFMMSSSSSSSSNSNSSCMVSTSGDGNVNGKPSSMSLARGRTRSWGWAFASPMRAFTFSKHSSSKRDITRQGSNMDAVPSLPAVRI